MEKLGVCMHGATLTLEANHAPLLAYAAEHLNGLVEAPVARPDIVVKCWWSQGKRSQADNPFPTGSALNIIGKRMLGNADELIWLDTLRMAGLQLRFCRQPGQWVFDVAYNFHPKKDKLEHLPEYEYTKYFSLMSYLVYYPLMWYLENFCGWTALHASALNSVHGGIIIGGLGGVGKTTTCVALLQHADIELIAENLIFTDGEFVYPCPEPIRLNETSLAMLGDNPQGLAPMSFPEGLKEKCFFHLKSRQLSNKATSAVLFLPQFAPRRYLMPLTAEIAAERLVAINRLTRELDDYGWYAAALDMTWPRPGQAQHRLEVIRRFAEQVRCFELGIDRAAGVEAVVEDIFRALALTE
jgi:hypothetical protein